MSVNYLATKIGLSNAFKDELAKVLLPKDIRQDFSEGINRVFIHHAGSVRPSRLDDPPQAVETP